MVVPITAFSIDKIVFKVAGAGRNCDYSVDRFLRQRRAPQVGMQDRAGEVEYAPQRGPRLQFQPLRDQIENRCYGNITAKTVGCECNPNAVYRGTQCVGDDHSPVGGN